MPTTTVLGDSEPKTSASARRPASCSSSSVPANSRAQKPPTGSATRRRRSPPSATAVSLTMSAGTAAKARGIRRSQAPRTRSPTIACSRASSIPVAARIAAPAPTSSSGSSVMSISSRYSAAAKIQPTVHDSARRAKIAGRDRDGIAGLLLPARLDGKPRLADRGHVPYRPAARRRRSAPLLALQQRRGADQRQVRERLGEVAAQRARAGLDLLGVEPQRAAERGGGVHQLARLLQPPRQRERLDHPKRAGQKCVLLLL